MNQANLIEKAIETQETEKISLPTRLLQIGGAALLLGGAGYLWYRNSSLKVYLELKNEDFYKLSIRVMNKLFFEYHVASKACFNKTLDEMLIRNPNHRLDFMNPLVLKEFNDAWHFEGAKGCEILLKEELKNSEHPKLGLYFYKQKLSSVFSELKKKASRGVLMSDLENLFSACICALSSHITGQFPRGFQNFIVLGQAERLDHKECLKLLFDYEMETLRIYEEFVGKLAAKGKLKEKEKNIKDFLKNFEERNRMEPLEVYARFHLGEDYGGELKFHPLLLFLHKALTPDLAAGYNRFDIEVLDHELINEPQMMLEGYLTQRIPAGGFFLFRQISLNFLSRADLKLILKKTGLKFKMLGKDVGTTEQ